MAFEGLSSKLQDIARKLSGKSRVSEKDLKETLREIKLVLLEADVNFKVVKDFIADIEEKALGEDVLKSLTPGQQVVKIVRDELTELLGGEKTELQFSVQPPSVIMLAGLQGSGKTTSAGKLANYLRKKGRKPMLVACDVYRPAAIDQLEVLGKQLSIPVYSSRDTKDVVKIAKAAKNEAISKLCDTLIIDTAGRLQIDEELMEELKRLEEATKPTETLLVIDSLSGQDAANVANEFSKTLDVTGLIFTKLDADTRGGATLSVKKITGKPIKFASVGEKMSDLEKFYPDRMANRILGMGDVLTLIDKAQEDFDEEEALKLEQKIKEQSFDLNDYLDQFKKIKKMGSISSILKMIPGMGKLKDVDIDEKEFVKIEAIIQSMTEEERHNPKILNASRRKRISKGSGTQVSDVNNLVKTFDMTKKMMKQATNPKDMKALMRKMKTGNFKNFKF